MDRLFGDLSSGVRMLVRYPTLSLGAVLTLGAGIGLRLSHIADPQSGGKAARVGTAGHVVQRRSYFSRQSLIFNGERRRKLPGGSGSQ